MDELAWADFLQDRFDTLVDQLDETDEFERDSIYVEAEQYYKEFLEAGFDPDLVAMLLSPESRVEHYEELTEYGATLDIEDLL